MELPSCPNCGGGKTRQILYGLLEEPPDPRRYVVGGCCLGPESPQYRCLDCAYEWRAEPAPRPRSPGDSRIR